MCAHIFILFPYTHKPELGKAHWEWAFLKFELKKTSTVNGRKNKSGKFDIPVP